MVYIFNVFPCVRLGKASSSPIATGYVRATAAALHLQNITYCERENHKRRAGQRNLTGPSVYTEFELSAPVLMPLFLGRCPWHKHPSTSKARAVGTVEASVAALGTTFDGAGALFASLYLERDRTSVKYFVAGVRDLSGITWQFWKKCWNGNTLLSSPSGEETQNHPFLASRGKDRGASAWGFVEDKFELVSKSVHMFLFALYTFLFAVLELFCFILARPGTSLSYKKLTYLRAPQTNY